MRCNLLIIDDELFVLEWLSALFGNCPDYCIYTASSGKNALEIIDKTEIHVMLSDICMPGMDGLKLLKFLREKQPTCQVVFLTGFSNFDYLYEAMQYEGVRYLLKSENDDKILTEVRKSFQAYKKIHMIDEITEPVCESTKEPEPPLWEKRREMFYSQSPIVMLMKKYIDSHLADDLSLQNLADVFHFNPSYLSRLYKTVTGTNLSDYVFNMRIEESKRMLADSNIRIKDIAERVGYDSSKSFARLFKRSQGVTPQEYRRRAQINLVDSGYHK